MSDSTSKTLSQFTLADLSVGIPAALPAVPRPVIDQPVEKAISTDDSSIESIDLGFETTLLDNMRDGVICVDAHYKIRRWNRTLELVTGITGRQMLDEEFRPSLISLKDEHGQLIDDLDCPIALAVRGNKKHSGRFKLVGRSGREVSIELDISPVIRNGLTLGAVALVQDTSLQMSMQQRLRDLKIQSVMDPLTQVANRSEFEKILNEFVKLHKTANFKCSIIVCDLDFFKRINDNFGHHVGDQALVSFAQLLKQFVRPRDLVARYGGEEFVILCANCDLKTAVERAEEIRLKLTQTPQQMLNGKCLTASFGVAQLKVHDNSTSFFIRADRALLAAKEGGRNCVQQAIDDPDRGIVKPNSNLTEIHSLSGIKWKVHRRNPLVCEEFISSTPVSVLVEQLRGYRDEVDAKVMRACPYHVEFLVVCQNAYHKERYLVDIEFYETDLEKLQNADLRANAVIRITIRKPSRSWFYHDSTKLVSKLLKDIRSYLMITEACAKLQIDSVNNLPASKDRR